MWDGQNLLQERSGDLLSKVVQYTDFPGYWGGLSSQRRGGTSGFYGFDSQSSSRVLVSIGGAITDSYSYKAFGEELASGSGTVNPYRYVGQYGYFRNTASRLYVRARHLEVTSGRWISRDPISFGDITNKVNQYMYAKDSPAVLMDYSGLNPEPMNGPILGACTLNLGCITSRPCVGITNDYAKECAANPNGLDCCASCVSATICASIVLCDLATIACQLGLTPEFPFNCFLLPTLCNVLQCQNSCMFNHWANHDTPAWKSAEKICKKSGSKSYICCIAKVAAEQDGYTRCAPMFGMFNIPIQYRLLFAIEVLGCCGNPPTKPGIPPRIIKYMVR